MAFESKGLNNIGGSMGQMNIWMYNTNDNRATVTASDYFLPACKEYNMRNFDIIIFAADDHRVMCQMYYNEVDATTHPLSAFV